GELVGADVLGPGPGFEVEVAGRLRVRAGRRVDRRTAARQPAQPARVGHQTRVDHPVAAGRRVAAGAGPHDVALPGEPGALVDVDEPARPAADEDVVGE